MNLKNKTILITGACSGIGKIMARKSLERGVEKLVVLDLNDVPFGKLSEEWKSFSKEIFFYKVDLSSVDDIRDVFIKIRQDVGVIDLLINNAGVVTGKCFHQHSHQDITLSLAVNTNALMHVALEVLPGMMAKNSGAICNICSSAGLISNPKMSVYAASKWAAVGWSDSLRLEMIQLNKNIQVTTMMPYYINTGMFDGVRSKLLPILDPEKTSEKFIRAIEKNKSLYAVPLPYWFIRISQGLLPLSVFDWVMKHVFGIYDTMKYFTGRKG